MSEHYLDARLRGDGHRANRTAVRSPGYRGRGNNPAVRVPPRPMSQRFLVYPILFLALTQLIPLLGGERRWYVAQISQLLVTLLACCGAIYFSKDYVWVPIAW